jgi:hypothetical protein
MKKPHMEFLIVMGCSLRELKALKQVEHAIVAKGAEAFLAAW